MNEIRRIKDKKSFTLYKLGERDQKNAKAGQVVCLCGCARANCGGSSDIDNATANGLTGAKSKDYTPQNSN